MSDTEDAESARFSPSGFFPFLLFITFTVVILSGLFFVSLKGNGFLAATRHFKQMTAVEAGLKKGTEESLCR